MTSHKASKTPEEAGAARSLLTLKLLSRDDRREAVAKDVRRRKPIFSDIPAHDLADALGIPEHWQPGSDWSFTSYAPFVSVEEHARYNSPASELVYRIEDYVSPERFRRLLEMSEPLDKSDAPKFVFLTKVERSRLERAIAEMQLEANETNGMSCVAHCSVESPSGAVLQFEGDIEDDGACITLRTPYDKRYKRFMNLSRCLTSGW